jgi:hypothetical protein
MKRAIVLLAALLPAPLSAQGPTPDASTTATLRMDCVCEAFSLRPYTFTLMFERVADQACEDGAFDEAQRGEILAAFVRTLEDLVEQGMAPEEQMRTFYAAVTPALRSLLDAAADRVLANEQERLGQEITRLTGDYQSARGTLEKKRGLLLRPGSSGGP